MVAYICSPRIWWGKAEESRVQGQPGIHSETLSLKKRCLPPKKSHMGSLLARVSKIQCSNVERKLRQGISVQGQPELYSKTISKGKQEQMQKCRETGKPTQSQAPTRTFGRCKRLQDMRDLWLPGYCKKSLLSVLLVSGLAYPEPCGLHK